MYTYMNQNLIRANTNGSNKLILFNEAKFSLRMLYDNYKYNLSCCYTGPNSFL